MADTNVFGGKKQRKVSKKGGDKDKDGGAAIEIGSILAPAVLYGLRRMVDAKGSRSAFPSRRSRGKRSGGGIFSSVPAPLNGEDSIGDWASASNSFAKPEDVGTAKLAGVVPATVAKPVEAGAVKPSGTAKPMDGGKKQARKAKKGGDKDQDDDEPMEGGKKKVRKARKARKGGADDDEPMYGGEYDEPMDGGKKQARKAKKGGDKDQDDDGPMDGGKKQARKAKKGGADEPMYGGEYGLVDGGKKKARKARKGGADEPMYGGEYEEPMEGGKKKARKAQKGGAMELFQNQLAAINKRIYDLLAK